ncbi:MAG: DNA polymerase III subunit delta' C-terminal domain-containing protein [Candidatus Makana argininalis]
MKWYFWLNKYYIKIINSYKNGYGHNSLIIHSNFKNGKKSLCYYIIRWLMCNKPYKKQSCGSCQDCKLMISNNHPDYYKLDFKKKIGINDIRLVNENIYNKSRQNGSKIIFLNNASLLQDKASNALLKILEESPQNTYFIFSCNCISKLSKTLLSRCICLNINKINEKKSLTWLKKKNTRLNEISIISALRICSGYPLEADILLKNKNWIERQNLCRLLNNALINNDFISLLPQLILYPDNRIIYWLISFIVDAIKYSLNLKKFISNIDKLYIIKNLNKKFKYKILLYQYKMWLNFFINLNNINNINKEILILNILIKIENNFFFI